MVDKLNLTNYYTKSFYGGGLFMYMEPFYTLFNFYVKNTTKVCGKLVQDVHTTPKNG